ncbi:MAG: Mu transposase domain-containing protein [Gammaproteobacteria bacterium]
MIRLLETHPYSAAQIVQRLREAGFDGGYTIVKDYVSNVRPKRAPAFLTLAFAPGEAAQVDWGEYGTIPVGATRRRLSFFVMVLCYSRLMYLEFTLSQTMEHFTACHQQAFDAFQGGPGKIMVDNLTSAVLKRLTGEAPVFNPRYLDFARHYGFATITPVRASKQFRIILVTSRYSVPAEYASTRLTLKAYPDRICLYHQGKLIARHARRSDRHQDSEDPDHPRALLEQRRNAREQKLLMRFLTLSPKSQAYYQQLQQRRLNPRHHLRQIVALGDSYGVDAVARAMEDAFPFQRQLPIPCPLHLTRRQDLLELEVPEPNLSLYDRDES